MIRVRLGERIDPIYEKMAWPPVTVWDTHVSTPRADLPWRASAIRYAGAGTDTEAAQVIDLVAAKRVRGEAPRPMEDAA